MRERRGHVYKVRLSSEERVALEARALREGKTPAALVRELAESDDVRPLPLSLSPSASVSRRA